MSFLNKSEVKQVNCNHLFVPCDINPDDLMCSECGKWFTFEEARFYMEDLYQYITELKEDVCECDYYDY